LTCVILSAFSSAFVCFLSPLRQAEERRRLQYVVVVTF
jgi:hypothetical protein